MEEGQIDEATVETLAEATEKVGLRRYLWLYFFVVPLAAVSASTVAIVISALQGLDVHPRASELYALVVIIGLKFVAAISVSYLIALVLALLSVGFANRFKNKSPTLKLQYTMSHIVSKTQLMMVVSLFYGATILAFAVSRFIWFDLVRAWEILEIISS